MAECLTKLGKASSHLSAIIEFAMCRRLESAHTLKAPCKVKPLCITPLVLCLLVLARAQTESSDVTSLAALIKSYYAAYAQKDLGALVRLWSERSPDLAASIEEAERTFAVEDHTFLNLVISLSRITGNKAIVQVTADTTITNLQTRAKSEARSIRNFALIKDGGQWKVWRDAPVSENVSAFLEEGSEWKVSRDTIEQFTNVLIAARTEDERNKLLAGNQQMMTPELREALIRRAGQEQTATRYQAALRILQLALAVAERASDKEGVALANRAMGDTFRALGQVAQALEHYQSAVAVFEAPGRRSDRAATLLSIGQTHFAQKKYDLAIESYSKALADYEALANTKATADTLEEMASVYYEQEKYDLALEHFERCLKLRERVAGKAVIASTLNSIGNVYFQQQEYDSAIQRYEKALAGFEELKDADAIVSTLSNIGSACYSQGSYQSALDHYYSALKLEEALHDRGVGASLRLSTATVYSALGNYSLALGHLRKGLAIYEELRDKNKTANALSDIAEAYFQLRNYNLALDHYQKSLTIFEQLKSLADTSMRLYAIGNVYFFMGKFDLAIENYQKALTQFEAIKHAPGVASMLASIAGTWFAQQKYDLAIESYQKSLALYEALGDKSRGAGVIERIASVYYAKAEYAQSLELAVRAAVQAEQAANLDTLWRARLTQGFAYRALNRIDDAQQSLAQSIAAIETMRNKLVRGEPDAQHFFRSRNAAYLAMMELLVGQNKVAEAFACAERIKANSLADILQRAQIPGAMTAVDEQRERKFVNAVVATKAQINHERERKRPDEQRLSNLNVRLQKALEDYHSFESRHYATHPRLKTLRGETFELRPEDAIALLPDSTTALIEFVVADTAIYLFVLTRDSKKPAGARANTHAYVLNVYAIKVGRVELADRVRRFRETIAQRDEKIQQSAQETYDLLFSAARDQLSGKTNWLIVPDDALWQLPFAALQPAGNRYLIEDHALAYAPSLIAFNEMTKPGSKSGSASALTLLAFGNPVISTQAAERVKLVSERARLDSSPESETEVKSLERLYATRPARGKAYVGAQASEELAKKEAGKFSVIHFAAPVQLNDGSPLYSHIALSQSEENSSEDGLLEAWELMRLDLKADLMALSEGEPSRERTSGEGLIGLSWASFVAGCPTTALSQWRGDSASTTALMLEFHRNLKSQSPGEPASRRARLAQGPRPGIGAARALQRAMLKLLASERYRHPFYWAGFEVIGNGR